MTQEGGSLNVYFYFNNFHCIINGIPKVNVGKKDNSRNILNFYREKLLNVMYVFLQRICETYKCNARQVALLRGCYEVCNFHAPTMT